MISTGRRRWTSPQQNELPTEDPVASQETVHAKNHGGHAPPLQTTFGLPADWAKLRDRGKHCSQIPEGAEAVGLTWPLPKDWDESRVEAALFPRTKARPGRAQSRRLQRDFAAIHEQLRTHHTYAEAIHDQQTQAWLKAPVNAFTHCGGIPTDLFLLHSRLADLLDYYDQPLLT